jgi:hypothetical protein
MDSTLNQRARSSRGGCCQRLNRRYGAALRVNQAYFEERRGRGRDIGEFTMTADQVFEMLFMVGSITPSHAGILLLFSAIPRNVEAPHIVEIMNGTRAAEEITRQLPVLFTLSPDDDTIGELKGFFLTLYIAWRLNQQVFLDA